MINNKKVVVVMPAYNAETTLEQTYNEIPHDIVDEVVICDDCSRDGTIAEARRLGITHIISHDHNKGYGGNQKSCYDYALGLGADIIVMLHPDYQYTPLLIPSLTWLVANECYPIAFGSRILGKGALKGGMPLYKYVCNRVLTLVQNLLMNQKLSEYHTGYRVYAAEALRAVDYHRCSDNFVFDNQIIAQLFSRGYEIGEVTCPTKYFPEASSINLSRSIYYGLGVLKVSMLYFLDRVGLKKYKLLH